MQLSDIKTTPTALKEDWGSSDWYPVMIAMKKAIKAGTSIEDAALDQAHTYYEDMGYDSPEDAVPRIIQVYKVRDEKGYIKEETLKEGYDERVQAAVKHLVSVLGGRSVKKEDVLTALHKYAAADRHSDAAEHNRHVMWGGKPGVVQMNGVPDYNSTPSARREFVKDVMAGLKGKLRYGRQAMSSDERKAKQQERKEEKAKRLADISRKVEDAISRAFPDGDPIDYIGPWMQKNNIEMDEVDAAMKAAGHGSYYKYLADMWDDMAGGAVHDAKSGHIDPNSPFYTVDDEGVVKKNSNPWK